MVAPRRRGRHWLRPNEPERIKKNGVYADGAGLYLQVTRGGSGKSWFFRYEFDGKEHKLGLGPLHLISLVAARELAQQQERLLLQGIDPMRHRNAERENRKLEDAKNVTFRECAEAWVNKPHGWQPRVLETYKRRLEKHLYPEFGDLPIQNFDKRSGGVGRVKNFLAPMWKPNADGGKPVMAEALQQHIREILFHAIAAEYIDPPNVALMTKGTPLRTLLPPVKNFHEPEHFAFLPHEELPQFMAKLRAWTYSQPDYCRVCSSPYLAEIEAARAAGMSFYKLERHFGIPGGTIHKHLRKHSEHRRPVQHARPISTYAAEALILIPARKMEVQKARWGDINWKDELLMLPAKRDSGEQGHKTGAKSGQAYILPLSDAAIKVLRTMETLQKESGLKITPDGYIFPAMDARGRMRERGHMASQTINAFLKRDFGYPNITVHGFRTTWRTWSRKYGYNSDDSEIVLNHKLGNRVTRSYDRDPIWERIDDIRKQLQHYANYCGSFQPPASQSLPEPLPNQGEIIPFDRPVERPSRRAVLARSRRGPS